MRRYVSKYPIRLTDRGELNEYDVLGMVEKIEEYEKKEIPMFIVAGGLFGILAIIFLPAYIGVWAYLTGILIFLSGIYVEFYIVNKWYEESKKK